MHRGRGRRVGRVVDWLDGSMTEEVDVRRALSRESSRRNAHRPSDSARLLFSWVSCTLRPGTRQEVASPMTRVVNMRTLRRVQYHSTSWDLINRRIEGRNVSPINSGYQRSLIVAKATGERRASKTGENNARRTVSDPRLCLHRGRVASCNNPLSLRHGTQGGDRLGCQPASAATQTHKHCLRERRIRVPWIFVWVSIWLPGEPPHYCQLYIRRLHYGEGSIARYFSLRT